MTLASEDSVAHGNRRESSTAHTDAVSEIRLALESLRRLAALWGVKPAELAGEPVCTRCRREPRRPGQSWGKACFAEAMRRTRPKYCELTTEGKVRHNCRSYTSVLVRRGVLQKEACRECGDPQSEAHHPDYANPRLVVWLCRECHRSLHRRGDAKAGPRVSATQEPGARVVTTLVS